MWKKHKKKKQLNGAQKNDKKRKENKRHKERDPPDIPCNSPKKLNLFLCMKFVA